jgi:hypothetical protein
MDSSNDRQPVAGAVLEPVHRAVTPDRDAIKWNRITI